jgi:hypothetical protein
VYPSTGAQESPEEVNENLIGCSFHHIDLPSYERGSCLVYGTQTDFLNNTLIFISGAVIITV